MSPLRCARGVYWLPLDGEEIALLTAARPAALVAAALARSSSSSSRLAARRLIERELVARTSHGALELTLMGQRERARIHRL